MKRRTTALAAALSLLPLGQPLLLGSTTALATAAVVLSTQAAHAQSAEDFLDAGVEKGRSGDYQGAIAELDKAIEINPMYTDAYYIRGYAKDELEDYQGAIADYSKAIEINPQYFFAYSNRGLAKDELEDYQGAIADYNKAIEINPRHAAVYNNRGIAKRNLGDQQGACADYKKAASLGNQGTAQWLSSADGAWCRNMR